MKITLSRPRTPPRWTRSSGEATLGVVMIVKNEAANLPQLLRTIADVADEVVVVDTGSSDHTLTVCREWGVRVVQDAWRDDFSAARNRSIEEATARYLLWLDADDRVPEETQSQLRGLRDSALRGGAPRAHLFQVANLRRDGGVQDVFSQIRLFPRQPGIRFRGAIHEALTESLSEQGVPVVATGLLVHHTGYADADVNRAKSARNQVLLRAQLERDPTDFSTQFFFAQTLVATGETAKGELHLTEALRLAAERGIPERTRAEMHMVRATFRNQLEDADGTAADLERAMELSPEWGVPFASLAQLRAEQQEWASVRELAERGRTKQFVPGIIAFRLDRSRSNLEVLAALAERQIGSPAEQLRCLRAALELDPTYTVARLELGQALLDQEAFEEARAVLEPLGSDDDAIGMFLDVCTAIGLARAMTGDEHGAGACLAPLLDILSEQLMGADDVGPMELAEALVKTGNGRAAANMLTLFRRTLHAAA